MMLMKGKVFIVRDKWETDSRTMNGSFTHTMYLAFNMESGVFFSIILFPPLCYHFFYLIFMTKIITIIIN